MFIFEKLSVYQKSLQFNNEIQHFLKDSTIDRNISDQLSRTAVSIALNIAEGTGRNTKKINKTFTIMPKAQRTNAWQYSKFLI